MKFPMALIFLPALRWARSRLIVVRSHLISGWSDNLKMLLASTEWPPVFSSVHMNACVAFAFVTRKLLKRKEIKNLV
jgi:hypothetical protein